jgi:uncharacterized protein (TIGR00369 family)
MKNISPTEQHWRALEAMYLAAPINDLYPPTIEISEAKACISLAVDPQHFHVMGSLHGSVYFKLLDDSAVFAVASMNQDHAIFTATFNCSIRAPVSTGRITATGKITDVRGRKVYAESTMTDDQGSIVATGSGMFMPAPFNYHAISEYQDAIK